MKKTLLLTLTLLLSACSGPNQEDPQKDKTAPPQESHEHQHLPENLSDNTPVYIVTSSKRYNSYIKTANFASKVQHLETKKDSVGRSIELLKTKVGLLIGISHIMQTKEKSCGGFMSFLSLEEANRYIANEENDKGRNRSTVQYSIDQQNIVNPWLNAVKEKNIRATIQHLENYGNRYYKNKTGRTSANWIKDRWLSLSNGRKDVTAELFTDCPGCGGQPNVILKVKGTKYPDEVIVIGGHTDSINQRQRGKNMQAPGADDNASGIGTITEIIRIALSSGWKPERSVHFMGYAAEEVGLVGSKAVAQHYKKNKINVIGVVQFDMTNYRRRGAPALGLLDSDINEEQNKFFTNLYKTYLNHLGKLGANHCDYKCSDHASWTDAGYAASFVSEAPFFGGLHTTKDTLKSQGGHAKVAVNFTKMGLAYLGELAKGSIDDGGDGIGTFRGHVNTNSSSFQPNGTKGFQWKGGNITGTLSSNERGDFDLYLQKKEGVRWIDIRASSNGGHHESITYNASPGKYRWETYAYDGSGAYQLTVKKGN